MPVSKKENAMNKKTIVLPILFLSIINLPALAQNPSDVLNFDETAEGPWSDIAKTTLTIPKVANGQVKLDGTLTSGEYGGFAGVPVVPGAGAWILAYAQEKDWKSAADSSFTFYLAYDDNYLYIGIDVKDDVVRSNDPPAQFWKDDACELLIDPLNTHYDRNTDSTESFFGGHIYFNWEGKFSEWENDAPRTTIRWSTLAEWSYGEDKEVYGFGKEKAGGYVTEIKLHKTTLVDPQSDFKWQEGQMMGFNIGLDDDDGADLALQYWWANRIRAKGYNEEEALNNWTPEEIARKDFLNPDITFYELGIDANGRLTPGGAGEIKLGPAGITTVGEWSLF